MTWTLKKKINWKRKIEINGEYGCMEIRHTHTTCALLEMGFVPDRVYAQLTNIAKKRPDEKGDMIECNTWDNAIFELQCKDKW